MRGLWFKEKPGPVHPNCNCEIRQETFAPVNIPGVLQGYDAHATHQFNAGQKITITIKNCWGLPFGVHVEVDHEVKASTGILITGKSHVFNFSKFSDFPVPWTVFLLARGGDGFTAHYFIKG